MPTIRVSDEFESAKIALKIIVGTVIFSIFIVLSGAMSEQGSGIFGFVNDIIISIIGVFIVMYMALR